jgi:Putative adhesin
METEQTLTRTESFDCDGPAELDLRVGSGRIEVRTADVPHVRVELAVEAGEGTPRQHGFEGLLGRISSGEYEPTDADAHAVRETQITFSDERRRLVVRTARAFRRIRLAVLVEAPDGSRLTAATYRGSITASGVLGGLKAATHAGDVAADRVDGDVDVRAGSGGVRLGRVTGRLQCRAGAGEIEVASVDGEATRLATGSGDVWLGAVRSDVQARTGKGNVVIADAAGGRLDIVTGSGDLSVAVRRGVAAEIDLVSGSGQARSELAVAGEPPPDAPSVRVRARTGHGDAVVTKAD